MITDVAQVYVVSWSKDKEYEPYDSGVLGVYATYALALAALKDLVVEDVVAAYKDLGVDYPKTLTFQDIEMRYFHDEECSVIVELSETISEDGENREDDTTCEYNIAGDRYTISLEQFDVQDDL